VPADPLWVPVPADRAAGEWVEQAVAPPVERPARGCNGRSTSGRDVVTGRRLPPVAGHREV